jgi:hypothetical protein
MEFCIFLTSIAFLLSAPAAAARAADAPAAAMLAAASAAAAAALPAGGEGGTRPKGRDASDAATGLGVAA